MDPIFSNIGDKWYDEEVGFTELDYSPITPRDNAGYKAGWSEIGASWYYNQDDPPIELAPEDCAYTRNGVPVLFAEQYLALCQNYKTLSLNKPLPPLPKFDEDDVIVKRVAKTSPFHTKPSPTNNNNNIIKASPGKGGLTILADRAIARKTKKTAELAQAKVLEEASLVIDRRAKKDATKASSITKKRRTPPPPPHPPPPPPLLSQLSGAKSFPGQFTGLPTTAQSARAHLHHADKVPLYMGSAAHLNNLILHKDIHPCPLSTTTEYSLSPSSSSSSLFTTAPTPDSDLGRCISHADQQSTAAASMSRSPGQEALRKEAHLECAAARLEGLVVGEYRYFQGHLTVEEYLERRMCICWQVCECSKLCTRFGDLLCPCACAGKLETSCR